MDWNTSTPVQILMVDDNLADVRLTEEAMSFTKIRNKIYTVSDGEQAMAFLRRQPPYAEAPRPDLILLDLNMPRKNGMEVLEEIRQDAQLTLIPVVILTTSQQETDIIQSYRLHANAYVTKPVDLDQFIQVVRSIEGFWLEIVKLPH
jgi:two-component system response regulator